MPYIPGENWAICDLSGRKVLMSQTRKTWDGLRVWAPLYYPKHPQLSLRGIPERRTVYDGRPRPVDIFAAPASYGWGSFCLISPNGTSYVAAIEDDGAMVIRQGTWGTPQHVFYIDHYAFTVDNDGALLVTDVAVNKGPASWRMNSVNKIGFNITVDTDLAVLASLVTVPTFMAGVTPRDGVFSLVSSGGISYVLYIVEDGALIAVPGSWGPASTNFYLGQYTLTVEDDGAVLARPSGELHQPMYRIVSPGGIEYMLWADDDGAIKVGREGHWWDVPSLVYDKVQSSYLKTPVPYTITENGQDVWVAE
jgi:hypothetical protein